MQNIDFNDFVKTTRTVNYSEKIDFLVELVKSGDNLAFDKIDEILRPVLRGYCLKKLANKSDKSIMFDYVQETILKVLESIKLGKFDGFDMNELVRYSCSIMIRLIIDKTRTFSSKNIRLFNVGSDGNLEINSISSSGDIEKKKIQEPIIFGEIENEKIDRLKLGLNMLKENEQEIIRLKYFVGLSHDEIAEKLGIQSNNSRVLTFRAVKKLEQIVS